MQKNGFTQYTTKSLLLEMCTYRFSARALILFVSLLTTFFGLMAPFFQKEFLDKGTFDFLTYSFISLFFSLGFSVLTNYLAVREATLMQKVLAERLYKHALTLRSDSMLGKPIGEIVSLYATDIPGSTIILEQSLPQGAGLLFPFILAPWVLSHFFTVPLWPLLSMMSLIILLSFFMAYRQSQFFFRFKQLAADRIGLVNEWIQNIRTLRILGWMTSFEKKIFAVREVETQNRIAMVTNGQAMNSVSSSVTFLLNLTALVSLVYLSSVPITKGTLMALLWIVGVFLTRPFRQMPWFFTFLFDSWTSLKRIAAFLNLRNIDSFERPDEFQKIKSFEFCEPAVRVRNLSLTLQSHHILKDINFDIEQSEFVAIVGEVGSGKSLLLLSLLGETGASFEQYQLGLNNALQMPLDQLRQFYTFIPQEGFIMSASLRENVAFDYDVKPERVDKAVFHSLELAQFQLQTERVDNGLDTEIGERGVNLSGGQKQRVSLARVDYHQAPIILMDDCLSAVDVDTENKLISHLIKGAWQNRTRIMVTHRLSVLEKVDRVLFLQDGRITAHGKLSELMKTNVEFANFVANVETNKGPQP